jgi:hypothetical protein
MNPNFYFDRNGASVVVLAALVHYKHVVPGEIACMYLTNFGIY